MRTSSSLSNATTIRSLVESESTEASPEAKRSRCESTTSNNFVTQFNRSISTEAVISHRYNTRLSTARKTLTPVKELVVRLDNSLVNARILQEEQGSFDYSSDSASERTSPESWNMLRYNGVRPNQTHLNPCSEPTICAFGKITKYALVTIPLLLIVLVFGFQSPNVRWYSIFTWRPEITGGNGGGLPPCKSDQRVQAQADKLMQEMSELLSSFKKCSDCAECKKQGTNKSTPVKNAMDMYYADQTGPPDFALASAGGSIATTRETRDYKVGSTISLFGWFLCNDLSNAKAVIQPNVNPGECWAFVGSSGSVVIKLISPIYMTGVTLEHIPKKISPFNDVSSAPKEFSIMGLNDPKRRGHTLGTFEYKTDGNSPVQYFEILPEHIKERYQFAELKIHSNHGNAEYTCVYRIRVHGSQLKPANCND